MVYATYLLALTIAPMLFLTGLQGAAYGMTPTDANDAIGSMLRVCLILGV